MVSEALERQAELSAELAAGEGAWPRITLVTPVFNSAHYLEATIRSVLDQRYPNLEYIMVDGGSTDGSVEIIRRYQDRLYWWVSEPDRGMYDALNKGFAHSSGEIMGWISATDLLQPGGLSVVGSVFRDLPQVEWITGVPSAFDERGTCTRVQSQRRWARSRFLAGANRYIQQESTFWRRSLWQRAGGFIDDTRRMASDFELWVRFFRYAQLYPVAALIGGFRVHSDSLGLQELAECHRIHLEIIRGEFAASPVAAGVKALGRLSPFILEIPVLKNFWRNTVISALMRLPGPDLPPVIRRRGSRWVLGE
jgi:glycosyltransferase involved in cell wall biosynthesis